MDLKYRAGMERVLIQPPPLAAKQGFSVRFHDEALGPAHLRAEGENTEFNSRIGFLHSIHFLDLNTWFQLKLFLPVEDTSD